MMSRHGPVELEASDGWGGMEVTKKYPCTYPGCLHSFNLRNTLVRHQRLKHGTPRIRPIYPRRSWKLADKPFMCTYPGCNRSYFSATGLQYHQRDKHLAMLVAEPVAAVGVMTTAAATDAASAAVAAVMSNCGWQLGHNPIELD
ncbi:hypothetical protein NP493_1049g00055 [Ridgeia piscesae]|uniref:C2H2-type domain-containing protein n=1 Tax=Ridgeia piscesae TaxID=27915 RepID=A0AAD9KI61_RIDPI|nr:hypothetical protein NP493_1049g00055 [Ridgeia piscesae]